MKQSLFNKAPQDRCCGTSLQGTVDISYAELVRIFGPPHSDGDGEKVDAEWVLLLRSGRIATIYNYKTGKNYNGNEGQATEDITDWHIGGTTKAVVGEVLAIIEHSSVTTNADLLAVVKEVVGELKDGPWVRIAIDKLEQAIARAEGRPHA